MTSPGASGAAPGHLVIEHTSPAVDGGRFPAKRVAGDDCVVEADIFRDGHDTIRAAVRWRKAGEREWKTGPMEFWDNDRWRGRFALSDIGQYEYTIDAWTDGYASWLADLKKRVAAGQRVASEVIEGAALIRKAAGRAKGKDADALTKAVAALEAAAERPDAALGVAAAPELSQLMDCWQDRPDLASWPEPLPLTADRERAVFGAWYEFFVRSQGTDPSKGGTFADAERRLPDIKSMGFDVLYLAPIHPIGRSHRKGRNNSLTAEPNDPGSPWAVGNEHGGHTAIEPALGTLADFDRFVSAAKKLDMEIALDFAIQCSPDHPWIKEHPEWFYKRPDGTIKYAENPPKKYEDIYPLNFDCADWRTLWSAWEEVVLFWVDHGVKIFRVDNPHTKPISFWQWLISRVQARHPDVLFLAEAFTRPKVMKALAKAGFTQSYTYFTWRNSRDEIATYVTELAETHMKEYFRPNFFANTPDILHEYLQQGGRPAFQIRLVLASTLSPTYGIYSGFELCENRAVPGTEEYQDSEKYEIKVRDWHAPGNIRDLVASLNAIRRENRALQRLANVAFLSCDNDQLLAYGRWTDDLKNLLIVVVNVDPRHAHHGTIRLPLQRWKLPPNARMEVKDLLTGTVYNWGEYNWVRLDAPAGQVAHVMRVEKRWP